MMSYNNVTWRCRVNWLHTRGGGAGSTGYTLAVEVQGLPVTHSG